MNIDVLRAREAAIEAELRDINTSAGDRSLNDEEQVRWTDLETEMEQVRSDLAAAEAKVKRAAEIESARARWGGVQITPVRTDAFDLGAIRSASADGVVEMARSAFGGALGHSASDEQAEIMRKLDAFEAIDMDSDDTENRAAEFAKYALVHGSRAYRRGFSASIRAALRGGAPMLTAEEAVAMRASLSLTSANGGYALPTLLDPSLIKTGTATKNPIRRVATVKQGMADKWNGVTAGAVTTAWKGEGSAFTDGTGTFGGVQVDAAALTAYVTGSYEIFADSGLMSDLPGLIGEAIDFAEQTAFISGSGSDAPYGIVTAISGTAGCTVTVTTRGSFTSASGADTLALLNALPTRYEDSSSWVMNKAIYRTIAQQTFGTSGALMIDMAQRDVLLDSPVLRCSDMVSATTSGNVLAVLGDFSNYVIYDRLGVNLEVIQNVVDGDGLPVGKRGLVAYKRVGANVATTGAFRFLKA